MSASVKPPSAKRRAHVQPEFVPLAERDHGADHEHAAGAFVVMRPRPDLAPGVAGDEVLEFLVERGLLRVGAIDPFVAQYLAALGHAALVAVLVVHGEISN